MSVGVEQIIEIISKEMGVTPDQIRSKKRLRQYFEARALVSYFLKMHIPDMTLKSIGIVLGGRHHSTVIHHIKTIEDFAEIMPYWKDKITFINSLIYKINLIKIRSFEWEVNTTI